MIPIFLLFRDFICFRSSSGNKQFDQQMIEIFLEICEDQLSYVKFGFAELKFACESFNVPIVGVFYEPKGFSA